MENEIREALALRCLEAGALAAERSAELPLRWDNMAALADGELRGMLMRELLELARDHYGAAQAVLGDAWAEAAAPALGLPGVNGALPERPLLVLGSTEDIRGYLPALTALRQRGGSPAIAVVWNGREEDLRLALDRADIRCHWLIDLESAAAAALQQGLLDFETYCRLLPQD